MASNSSYDPVSKTAWTPDHQERLVEQQYYLIEKQRAKITDLNKQLRENSTQLPVIPRNEIMRVVDRDLIDLLGMPVPGPTPQQTIDPPTLKEAVRAQFNFILEQQIKLENDFLPNLKAVARTFAPERGRTLFVVPVETCLEQLKVETTDVTVQGKRVGGPLSGGYG